MERMKNFIFSFAVLLTISFCAIQSTPLVEGVGGEDVAVPLDEGTEGNPGIKVTVTSNGLAHISRYGYRQFNDAFQTISIPSFSRELPKDHWVVCKQLDYKCEIIVWDTRITGVDVPSFRLLLNSPNQVGFTTSGGSLRMEGKWRKEDWSRIRKLNTNVWPWRWENHETVYARWPIGGPGSYTATANGFSITMTGNLRKNSQGLPELTSVDCQVKVESMDFNFNAGHSSLAGFLANQMKPQLTDNIKPQFEGQTRSIVLSLMQPLITQVDAMLRRAESLNQNLNLPDFELNYRLLEDPKVGVDYIETNHVGDLKHKSNQPTPFYPPEIHKSNQSSRMIYVHASDYLLNSFLYQAYMANLTEIHVTSLDNGRFASFMRTSCPGEICMITLLPNMAREFPNVTAEMILKATAPPKVIFKEEYATVETSGSLEIFFPTNEASGNAEQSSAPTLKANMKVKAHLLNIKMEEQNGRTVLHTDVEVKSVTVESLEYRYGDRDDLNFLINFLTPVMQPYINRQLDSGVPLMLSVGQYLKNPNFKFLDRTLEIGGDLIL